MCNVPGTYHGIGSKSCFWICTNVAKTPTMLAEDSNMVKIQTLSCSGGQL